MTRIVAYMLAAAVASLLVVSPAAAATLPEGPGLAARYPGDRGIAKDPAVVFTEDFEEGGLEAVLQRWENIGNKDGKVLSLSRETPPGSGGRWSLQVTATLGENQGGHLYRRLPRPLDQAFVRFYVRFPEEAGYIHHFVHLGGYRPPTSYAQGGAGVRPRGDDRVTISIEPTGDWGRYSAPGIWHLYAYWHEMRGLSDGNYWGNSLRPARPAVASAGRWQCVEVMLKMNSAPDKHDGELAFWLDGKLQAHFAPGARQDPSAFGVELVTEGGKPFQGFRWRTNDDLKINFLWLLHYVTEQAATHNHVEHPNPVNRVWFDDVVVSSAYIGPMKR